MAYTIFSTFLVFLHLSPICRAENKINHLPPEKSQLSRNEKLIPTLFSDGKKYNDPDQFTLVAGTESSIDPKKLPKIRTQDGMPLCQTFCPTVLAEHKMCEEKKVKDCSNLPDEDRISPISTLMYRDTDKPGEETVIGNIASSGRKQPYQVMNTITSAPAPQYFYSESCLPFDIFVKKFKENELLLSTEIETLKKLYISAKLQTEASVEGCQDCLKLKDKFDLFLPNAVSIDEVVTSLKIKDFNSFMHTIMLKYQKVKNPKKCKTIKFEKDLLAEHFPGPFDPVTTMDGLFNEINNVLAKKKPLILSPICAARLEKDNSCDYHCIVLTGKKRVKDKKTGEEVDLLKIHNSWGDGWQESNNDGWVPVSKLKSMMTTYDDQNANNTVSDRKHVYSHSISWFK